MTANRYAPHQGARECARRLQQISRGQLVIAGLASFYEELEARTDRKSWLRDFFKL
jgi:hypothetical protein